MKFTAAIEIRGINPYILVSAERAQQVKSGWKKPMPVSVQVNGEPEPAWCINMMPAGDGSFYLYLDGMVREASGTKVGDHVQVSLTFDRSYLSGPQHEMPSELLAGLAGSPVAAARWETLSPSLKKEILRYLSSLRSDQTRQRNVERTLRVMSGAKERFLARNWN
jgi:hypothetical protein